jgi:hypothetical protein
MRKTHGIRRAGGRAGGTCGQLRDRRLGSASRTCCPCRRRPLQRERAMACLWAISLHILRTHRKLSDSVIQVEEDGAWTGTARE